MVSRIHGYKLILCLSLILILLLQTGAVASGEGNAEAEVVDPIGNSGSYSAVVYNNTNGLPTTDTNAIAETGDGFIWIGGYSGLIRYDGDTFERMDSTTGVANVICLLVDSKDRLWIGTNDNGLALMENGQFRLWNVKDGLGSEKICDIAEDDQGLIYVGTTAGIVVVDEQLQLRALDDPRISGIYMDRFRMGSDGLIYGVSTSDDIFTMQNGEVVSYLSHNDNHVKEITAIFPDPDFPGNLFAGTAGSVLYYGKLQNNFQTIETVNIAPLTGVLDIQKIGEQIWVCARNGIGVITDTGFHHLDNVPMNNSVVHVMADYEGNLWFASTRQGVMKIVRNPFSDLFEQYGLEQTVVNSTCLYHDRLYIGTDTGLTVLSANGRESEIPLNEVRRASGELLEESDLLKLLEGNRIRSVICDSSDRLWISTWRGCGLIRLDGETATVFSENDGLLSSHIRTVCERPDGSILVVNSGGVSVIEGDRVTKSYGEDAGIENPESLSVSYADNGDILLGSNGDGIYIINEEGTRCINRADGLSSGVVMRIKRDRRNNVWWLVTSNSIAYMTPDYRVTTIQKFPYSNNFDMYENSRGDMWILSSDGIYVLPTEELLANGEMKPVHYGLANGLPCITTSNSYSALTPEGNLYISGNTGVAKINIDQTLEDVREIKVTVPYVDADGLRVYPNEQGLFNISSSVQRLTVYSYVFNYSLTDPQVTYHLSGFDRDSVTVKRSELAPVNYTNLPGGTYNFVVQLRDSLGYEDKTVAVTIVKAKGLFEQTWFYILIALAAIALLIRLNYYYFSRKTRILEEKQKAAVKEERLNTELHTARIIQKSMMPHEFPPFPDRKEFDIYASMDPAREVGGDFYDFFMIDEDHLCLVIADVSGKGIPASLFMMVSKVILQSCAMLGQSTADILKRTNEALCSNNQVDMFVTVWLGILEVSTGRITAANAGHEYPAMMMDGRFLLVKDKHGLVIGGLPDTSYEDYELHMKPGDKLFIYTDGVPEAMDAEKKMFGTERMIEALNKEPNASPEKTLENVRRAVDDFVNGEEQFDDLTMLCIEYNGPQKDTQ